MEDNITTFQQSFAPAPEAGPPVSWTDAFSSGFKLENDVVNAWEFLTQDTFEPEDGYVNSKALKDAGLWDYRESFIGVQSSAELSYKKKKFEDELELRRQSMEGGWPGFFGSIAGGVLSPTSFIPLVGPEVKGAAALRQALLLGTTAGVLQEIPLQLNQSERTMMESGMSVLGQAVISGILGGLAGRVRNRELSRIASDMAVPSEERAILTLGKDIDLRTRTGVEPEVPRGHVRLYRREGEQVFSSNPRRMEGLNGEKEFYVDLPKTHPLVRQLDQIDEVVVPPGTAVVRELAPAGAQVTFQKTEGLKQNVLTKWTGMSKATEVVSPVAEVIEQSNVPDDMKFFTARWMMQQLTTGGMRQAANVAGETPAVAGHVEQLAAAQYGKYFKARSGIDEAYYKYIFEDEATPTLVPALRAKIKAAGSGKLFKRDFLKEVGRAARQNDTHHNPAVAAAAKALRTELLDPLLKEAKEVGIYKEVLDVIGDPSYLMRVYDPVLVSANRPKVIKVLAEYYAGVMEADFVKAAEKFRRVTANVEEFKTDVARPYNEAEALRQKFLTQLKEAELKRDPARVLMETRIRSVTERLKELREEAKLIELTPEERAANKKKPQAAEIEKLTGELDTLKKLLPPPDGVYEAMKKEAKQRLRNLNRSMAVQANERAGKLARVDRIEELNFNSLTRMSGSLQTALDKLDTFSDEALDAEVTRLRNSFAKLAKEFDSGEEKLVKLRDDAALAEEQLARQEGRSLKLSDIAAELEMAEGLDREGIREIFQDAADTIVKSKQRLIERRAVRAEKLRTAAASLAPEKVKGRVDEVLNQYELRKEKFLEDWRAKGLDDVQGALEGVAPDFRQFAEDRATEVAHALTNMTSKLPVHDIIVGAHGPEKARMLGISSEKLEFVLENDADIIARAYIRTLAPDIELAKRFGDFNVTSILGKDGALTAEFDALSKKIATAVDKKGQPLSDLAKQKLQVDLEKRYKRNRDILQAMVDRLRHTRGLPENPDGLGYRAGSLVKNLNVLRYMGMVTISSLPDVANIILKHGLTRTFKDVFIPFITNFKQMQLSAREVYLAGEALDIMIHTRADALYDIGDVIGRHSRFERGVEYATSRMGIIGGFDLWNRELKKLAGLGTIAHLMDDMKVLMVKGSAKEQQKAGEYLASLGLGPQQVERIWKQINEVGAADQVNGLWWPNTEQWVDKEAVRLFRQALTGDISSTIITPGLERPLWIDKNIGFKMLGQFKSFAFASQTKTVMAGLQAPDMALVHSTLFSLSLGSLSYYLWALAAGGDALDEALEFDPAKWADESIARSGRLGIGQEVWDVAQLAPGIRDYATFSGGRVVNRQGADFTDLIMGPSFDALLKAGGVFTSLDEPTRNTLHIFRQLLPFQNLFYFRQILDQLEGASGLPKRRS